MAREEWLCSFKHQTCRRWWRQISDVVSGMVCVMPHSVWLIRYEPYAPVSTTHLEAKVRGCNTRAIARHQAIRPALAAPPPLS